jgi:hypothetical protein
LTIHFIHREAYNNQIKDYFIEKLDSFFHSKLIVKRFERELRLYFKELAIYLCFNSVVKIAESNEHGSEFGGLGRIVSMYFFGVVDERTREDSNEEGEDFIERKHELRI